MTRPNALAPTGDQPPAGEHGHGGLGGGIPLGHWAGVSISAHWSILFTAVLITDLLATSALPAAAAGHEHVTYWIVGGITAVAFLFTVLMHELAHAIVARHYGVRVKRITLWMLGGLTELDGDAPTPRADAFIAGAGPLTSLGIGACSAALDWWLGGTGPLVAAALGWLAGVSVILGVFNLLPAAPLDGGRLLRGVLWWRSHDRARAQAAAARTGRFVGFFLIALGLLDMLSGAVFGLWLALIGWFIVNGANAEEFAAQAEKLKSLRAEEVMTACAVTIADWWTVQQLLNRFTLEQASQELFPLVDFAGETSGIVTMRDIERVPIAQRDSTRIRDLRHAHRSQPLLVASSDAVADLLPQLRLPGSIAIVIDKAGHPVGFIRPAELARAAHLAEIGWQGPSSG